MKKNTLIAFVVTLLIAVASFACDCGEKKCEGKTCPTPTTEKKCTDCEKKPQVNATFESIKKLAGNWEITTTENGKTDVAKASYEVTSGGNVVLEKIFIGTPQEMVSVYSNDGTHVTMTHYCMLPNTPRMSLIKSEPGKAFFEMKGKDGIKSRKEHHMHSVELIWNNENQLTQNWTSVKNGKKEPVTAFTWNRVVAAAEKNNGSKSTK